MSNHKDKYNILIGRNKNTKVLRFIRELFMNYLSEIFLEMGKRFWERKIFKNKIKSEKIKS